MAWDHASGFWMQLHGGLEGIYPARNLALGLTLFLARFVSHWCAPTFVFLSGVSLALSVKNRLSKGDTQRQITIHIIKRGLLLLVFEALFVSPAFDLPRLYFGVIAAIGVSLIIFSVGRHLPTSVILAISLIIVLNHQWLDLSWIPMEPAWSHYLRRILHEPGFSWRPYFALYPVFPWLGVVGLGWTYGSTLHGVDRERMPRMRLQLAATGIASIALFFVVRLMNGYGNLVRRWSSDILDILYVSKYPPSVAFLLWGLGGMCLFLALGLIIEGRGWSGKGISGVIHVFGRTPLFFYLSHLWLYRLRLPGVPVLFHLDMMQTLVLWAAGLVVLWMLCSRYEKLKRRYPSFLRYI